MHIAEIVDDGRWSLQVDFGPDRDGMRALADRLRMTQPPEAGDLREAILLTRRYRLLPTKGQHCRLSDALEISRQLYNAALEERIDCYRKTGKGLSYFSQTTALAVLRKDMGLDRYAWAMLAYPLKQLHNSYETFFRKGGFPRFKGRDWFKSIGWTKAEGCRIRDGRLVAKGIGAIRIHLHQPLPREWKYPRVKREGRHWYLFISTEVECAASNDNVSIGIDVGIEKLAALSDGTMIANLRAGKKAQANMRRRQRALARCKRGSSGRRAAKEDLGKARAKIARQRSTYLHQVSADIAKRFGLVAVERLRIVNMSRSAKGSTEEPGTNVRQKAGLNSAILDAGWGRLKELLRYKLRLNGGELIEVDPKGTSQLCSDCGVFVPKQLAQRWHDCPDCGLSIDRDHNAARNVLHAAMRGRAEANEGDCAERSPGKVAA